MSSLLVQTQCLSGKESGGSWKVSYHSLKKIFVGSWRLGEGYESGELCYGTVVFFCDLDGEIHCRKSYHLVASICHSGTLAAGHYTAHVLHKQDSQWLLCAIQSSEVDNKLSYVLFYELS